MQRNLIINLILIVIVIIFALQNHETIPLKLFLWEVEVSKSLLIVLVFVAGVLLGVCTSSISTYLKNRKKKKEEAKKAKEAEQKRKAEEAKEKTEEKESE